MKPGFNETGKRPGEEILSLEQLVPSENFDPRLSFELENEKDKTGDPVPGKAFWLKLAGENGQTAEGKLYLPEASRPDTLVLFEPGMPGDSVKWMEEKHASYLVRHGLALMVMRHLGTRLAPQMEQAEALEAADKYVHCPERVIKNPSDIMPVIGAGHETYSLTQISQEAVTALDILGKKFPNIRVAGHSFGGIFLSVALGRLDPEVKKKVTHFISLAGGQGGLENLSPEIADYEGYLSECRAFINIQEPKTAVAEIGKLINIIRNKKLPEHVMSVQVAATNDNYLPLESNLAFHNMLGRGLMIKDSTQTGEQTHDLNNLRPETLLRLIETPYHPRRSHVVEFKNLDPKPEKN